VRGKYKDFTFLLLAIWNENADNKKITKNTRQEGSCDFDKNVRNNKKT